MGILITVLAILLVSRGVLQTFMKDLYWALVRYQYTMVGLTPTRTATWERWTTLWGALLLATGIALYVVVPR